MFDKGNNITVLISDESMPDTFPIMADGSSACIIRYHGMTMENLKF